MNKEKKQAPKKKRGKRGKYEPKLKINATFLEVINIAVSQRKSENDFDFSLQHFARKSETEKRN